MLFLFRSGLFQLDAVVVQRAISPTAPVTLVNPPIAETAPRDGRPLRLGPSADPNRAVHPHHGSRRIPSPCSLWCNGPFASDYHRCLHFPSLRARMACLAGRMGRRAYRRRLCMSPQNTGVEQRVELLIWKHLRSSSRLSQTSSCSASKCSPRRACSPSPQ